MKRNPCIGMDMSSEEIVLFNLFRTLLTICIVYCNIAKSVNIIKAFSCNKTGVVNSCGKNIKLAKNNQVSNCFGNRFRGRCIPVLAVF